MCILIFFNRVKWKFETINQEYTVKCKKLFYFKQFGLPRPVSKLDTLSREIFVKFIKKTNHHTPENQISV